MKPSEIIKLARRQTWCTLDVVTEEEAYQFLNFIIEDFGADIRSSESWFGFDVVNFDVYANQPMYTFDEDYWEYSQNFPISKIQSVWLLDQKTNKWRDIPVHFVDKMNPNDFDSKSEPMVAFVTRSDITLKFHLINKNDEWLSKNFEFMHALFAGSQWLTLTYGIVAGSNVYHVVVPRKI